jgi:hypothetical protein
VVSVADGRGHEVDLHLLVPQQPHRRHNATVFDVIAQPQTEKAFEPRGEVVAAEALLTLHSARIETFFEEMGMEEAKGRLDVGRVRRHVEVDQATEFVEFLSAKALLLNECHEGEEICVSTRAFRFRQPLKRRCTALVSSP